METDSTENYDQVESTIKPPEADVEQPEPVEKPKRRGRPAGAKDAYKRTRKSTKPNASPANNAEPFPESKSHTPERYEQPMGLDMNTLADIMLERMTIRASDAKAQRTKHWAKFMPNR